MLECFFHVAQVSELVCEFVLDVGFCLTKNGCRICEGIESVHFELSALGNILEHIVPDAAQIAHHLLAVRITHLCVDEGFYCALVGSDLEDLHLHAEFLHQAGVEDGLARHSAPVNRPDRIEVDLVCNGAQIVGCARIIIAVSHNPFA